MKKILIGLLAMSFVAQGTMAAGALSGFLPETIEGACSQINAANGSMCRIIPASDSYPYRILILVETQEQATAYTLAATALGTLSCKNLPTVITFGVSVKDSVFRTFDMWCSPENRNIKLMHGWQTVDLRAQISAP